MGWTAPRTWVTSEVVTAALLNAHVRDNLDYLKSSLVGEYIKNVCKASNETLQSNNTLQDDDELLFAIGASEKWGFSFYIFVRSDSTGTANIKVNVTAPSGATLRWAAINPWAPTPAGVVPQLYPPQGASLSLYALHTEGATEYGYLYVISGVCLNSTNAGNVTLQWAQVNSEAKNTTVYAGSYLIAHKLG